MKVVRSGAEKPGYPGCFSGDVVITSLMSAASQMDPEISTLTYGEGVISKWHTHPGGQMLYVLSDSALIGSVATGTMRAAKGEFFATPANERHYHGSIEGEPAQLLSLTWGVTKWEADFPDLTGDDV